MLHRAVCFVCGSLGADTRLYTKSRDKEPYFPFLEHHDPPRGSRTPGADGAVDSCRVCYAFLRQQWEAYERTKTPAIKRLYWLKRSDNGHFTGAETRLQGEYIAQVMGFQFNPTPGTYDASGGNYSPPLGPQSHFDRSTGSVGQMSRSNTLPPREAPSSSAMSAAASSALRPTQGGLRQGGMQGSEGVLDLSLPVKPQTKGEGSISGSTRHDKKRERDFPSHGSRKDVIEGQHGEVAYQGHVDVYNRGSTRTSSQMTGHHSATVSYANSSKPTADVSNIVTCFTCALELPFSEGKLVYSCRQDAGGKEPYFPFLESLSPPPGAVPVVKHGATKLCLPCLGALLQQWDAFVAQEVPVELRQYRLPRKADRYKYSSVQSSAVSAPESHFTPKLSNSRRNINPESEICYLCGQLYQSDSMKLLFTRAPNSNTHRTMYFPFVRDLPRPKGAKPLDQEGTVLSCRSCYGHLQKQWQMYQAEAVYPVHRTYTLRAAEGNEAPPGSKLEMGGEASRPGHSDTSISEPLNIQIAANSPGPMAAIPAQGLLAIAAAPTVSSTSTTPNYHDSSPVSSTQVTPKMADGRRLSGESKPGSHASTVPHPLTQMTSIPQKVCFVCGEKGIVTQTHMLCSYPSRLDAKAPPGQANPFFPFLANRDPAGGAEGMTEDGTVCACKFCYYLLLTQWKEYETSPTPSDSNRWLRKYSLKEFICYVCSAQKTRKRMRTLHVKPFHFLKEHKAPPGAIVMDNGDTVAACRKCCASLLHQMKEYDRMGLPMEMRKYNWIPAATNKGPHLEDADDNDTQMGCDSDGEKTMGGCDELSNGSLPDSCHDDDSTDRMFADLPVQGEILDVEEPGPNRNENRRVGDMQTVVGQIVDLGQGAVETEAIPNKTAGNDVDISSINIGSYIGVQHGSDIYPAVVVPTPDDFEVPPPSGFYGLYFQPSGTHWKLNETPFLLLHSDVVRTLSAPNIIMTGARVGYKFDL